MRFVGTGKQAERSLILATFPQELVNDLHVRVVLISRVFEGEDGAWLNVSFATKGYPVTEWFQVVHDAPGPSFHEGVVRVRSTLDRVDARVNVVPCGRTHGGSLEAASKTHTLACEGIDIGSMSLSPVAANVTVGAIIRNDEQEIRLRRFFLFRMTVAR